MFELSYCEGTQSFLDAIQALRLYVVIVHSQFFLLGNLVYSHQKYFVHVRYNSKMMAAFVVPWAGLELQPPALQLSDSHFVLRCVCSAPH